MRIDTDRCPLVVLGAWNPAIFSPQWVGQRIFESKELDLQVGFGLQGRVSRFQHGSVALTVAPGQLTVVSLAEEPDFVGQLAHVALAVLHRLPETPVSAFGFNFGFDVPGTTDRLSEALWASDIESLQATYGKIAVVGALRELDCPGRGRVRLSVSKSAEDSVRIDVNHHTEVESAAQASELIEERSRGALDFTVDLLRCAFMLEPA